MGTAAIGVTPLNDHELAIARTVDLIAIEGLLYLTSIPKIAAALDFMTYRTDSEFLVNYVRWRMDKPFPK